MDREPIRELIYHSTNENLEAIALALQPNSNDKILAICGSGDQAFVLLEDAREVCCVDKSNAQIKYVESRREGLMKGDYKAFLPERSSVIKDSIWGDLQMQMRKEYFDKKNRINKIKEKLNRLTIKHGDIVEISKIEPCVTKVYLSNAIGYERTQKITKETFAEIMNGIAAKLPIGGLIYISNHEDLCERIYTSSSAHIITTERGSVIITDPKDIFSKHLIIDPELTTVARRYEDEGFWSPTIYRKI